MSLSAEAVHVWWADPQNLIGKLDDLTQEELATGDRFRFEHDRALYLATRVLVRTTLSRYANVPAWSWRFAANPYGRPEIEPISRLRFNLSNTRGLVVCAVAWDAEIGVDVENTSRGAPLSVAESYFAPSEIATLRSIPAPAQHARFFDYWTLKESYIKARGLGLALPLERFAMELSPNGPPRIIIDAALDDDGAWWQLDQHRPSADHVIALCVRRDRPGVERQISWNRHRDEPGSSQSASLVMPSQECHFPLSR